MGNNLNLCKPSSERTRGNLARGRDGVAIGSPSSAEVMGRGRMLVELCTLDGPMLSGHTPLSEVLRDVGIQGDGNAMLPLCEGPMATTTSSATDDNTFDKHANSIGEQVLESLEMMAEAAAGGCSDGSGYNGTGSGGGCSDYGACGGGCGCDNAGDDICDCPHNDIDEATSTSPKTSNAFIPAPASAPNLSSSVIRVCGGRD